VKQYIGCDAHRKYSVFRIQGESGPMGPAIRVNHERGELERFLGSLEPGSPVALEAGLNWMWMVEQIEKANLEPRLTNPLEAKKRMGGVNKLDSSDAAGLLTLLRSGTLPEVWIPRGGQRDLRGLVRSRLVLRRHVSGLKCRIHGVLTQYGLKPLADEEDETEYRDWFTVKARAALLNAMEELPSATREAMRQEYLAMWELERHVKSLETAIQARAGSLGWMRLLRTMPGVGLDTGGDDLDRDRRGQAIRQCRTVGGICGADAAHTFVGRKDVAGADAAGGESLSEMGLRGGGERDCGAAAENGKEASARGAALRAG
jgi:hypothetical protein